MGTLQCFRIFRVSKKFMHRKQTSRISVDYFLSHNAENLHTVTLQCFRKFWGIEKIHAEKGDTANGGLKNVKNGTFRVSMKFMHKKWLSCFSVENILSHSVVGNRGDFFCIRKILVTKKKLDIKGHYRPFLSKFFLPHSVKKHRRVAPQCFRNFRVSKKFMHKKSISRKSVKYFLSHSAEFFCTGTLQCFRKFGVSKKFMHKKEIS